MKEFNRYHLVALEDSSTREGLIPVTRALGCCLHHCNKLKGLDGCKEIQKENSFSELLICKNHRLFSTSILYSMKQIQLGDIFKIKIQQIS